MSPRRTAILATTLTAALVACGTEEKPHHPGAPPPSTGQEGMEKAETPPACETALQAFQRTVWEPVLHTNCFGCHVAGGFAAKQGARFVLQSDSVPDYLATNMEAFRREGAITESGTSLLLLKPTNSVQHRGGKRFEVGSKEYEAFAAFLSRTDWPDSCP